MISVSKFAKIAAVFFALSLVVGIFLFSGKDYTGNTLKLDKALLDILNERGVSEKDLIYESRERRDEGKYSFLKVIRHYEPGPDFDADEFITAAAPNLKKLKFNFAKSSLQKEKSRERFSAFFSFKNRILYELEFFKKKHSFASLPRKTNGAKIAIVLDDFGYNINNLKELFEINSPLTLSVLPNLPYSKRIAREIGKRNFELILHLPLEPHNKTENLEKGTIMVNMPPKEVDYLLAKAIESVPGLKGVSNHMGSKATEDRVLMREILNELQKRNLYFLDNLVTDKSVCGEVASEIGLPIAIRSVFLDNESDENYIRKQLLQTARLASKSGWAIGVGHDRPHTIKVLKDALPQLEREGFRFVYVSELIK